jgi:hypothetical protein
VIAVAQGLAAVTLDLVDGLGRLAGTPCRLAAAADSLHRDRQATVIHH